NTPDPALEDRWPHRLLTAATPPTGDGPENGESRNWKSRHRVRGRPVAPQAAPGAVRRRGPQERPFFERRLVSRNSAWRRSDNRARRSGFFLAPSSLLAVASPSVAHGGRCLMKNAERFLQRQELTRRSFLRLGAAGAAAFTFWPLSSGAEPTAPELAKALETLE